MLTQPYSKMKNILYTFFAAAGMLILNSCIHDSCVDLNCQNGGSCIDDVCQCPDGYEGPECTIMSNERFRGMWVGMSKCEGFPQRKDTVEFVTWCNPDQLQLHTGMGNLRTNLFVGTARTPEMVFESYEDTSVVITPYVRVDANQMQITIVSVNKRDGLRYVCEFEGRRIEGTQLVEGYITPKGDCE